MTIFLWNSITSKFHLLKTETINSMGQLHAFPLIRISGDEIFIARPNPDDVGIIVYATYVAWCQHTINE